MAKTNENLPFGGDISRYFQETAPASIRGLIANKKTDNILTPGFPYCERWSKKKYETTLAALQIELVKLQAWAKSTGARVVIVFEGRDAAGKGGTIKRFREYLNPRSARVVALAKPNSKERGQWYFQRYIEQLPAAGELVFFDRSWYNRAVIEQVFGFCSGFEREQFFAQVQPFEDMLVNDGIRLFKIWLNVGRAEQLRRFLDREGDPLKQWKLSQIDVDGLSKWAAYSDAISETFARTDHASARWTVIRADDKRRARVGALETVLSQIDYDCKESTIAKAPDSEIVGGSDLWHA